MRLMYFLLLFILFAGPVLGFQKGQPEQLRPKELSELPGMSPTGSKYMLGATEVRGVKSVAYLNDVRNLMTKYGLQHTHHIMVSFEETGTGHMLISGSVELTVIGPAGSIVVKEKLFAMEGSFGTDIKLSQKGQYRFEIRTLLHDGVERLFLHDFRQLVN